MWKSISVMIVLSLFGVSFIHSVQADEKKIGLDYIYKKDELKIPALDPDLPRSLQWSKQGHMLAYLVSYGTEAPSLTVYDPAKDATVALMTPQALYDAVELLKDSTSPITIEKTMNASPILDGATDHTKIDRFSWDEDESVIYIHADGERYRFDPADLSIATSAAPEKAKLPEGEKDHITYSPNERFAAYTRGNELYAYDTAEKNEMRLTHDGSESVLNARLTWVYWEELYHRQGYRGYSWSPDNGRIAYMQFNETGVSTYPVTDFSKPIPETLNMFYPKAGTKNPTVRVGIASLSTRNTVWVDLGAPYEYIARMGWSPDGEFLFVQTLNRKQDELTLHFADPATGASHIVLQETSDTWVDVNGGPFFLENSDDFLWLSERSGWRHLYRYSHEGKLKRQLTDGEWEINYNKWQEEGNFVMDEENNRWFIKSTKDSPIENHTYSMSLTNGRMKQLTKDDGQHSLTFSADHQYAVNRFRSVSVPQRVEVIRDDGKQIRVLGETTLEDYHPYQMQVPELIEIEDDEGILFYAKITKPLDFDPEKKYPVICYVYGGPGAQVVHNAPLSTREMMFVNEGYILFSIDNRGSKSRGKKWADEIYERFGTVELEDLLTGVDYLNTLPYVDHLNIGIWGWSYGGYFSCIAMVKAPDVFRAGAAVAPVTDYHLYDTIYTERFMQKPQDNPQGYHDAAVTNFVDDMKGSLLLAHGISDDNVHVQNIYQLVDELIEKNKDYELYLYPEKYHGIGGNSDQYHLFDRILSFFNENLKE